MEGVWQELICWRNSALEIAIVTIALLSAWSLPLLNRKVYAIRGDTIA